MRNRGGAAAGRPPSRSRRHWITLIAGASVLLAVGGSLSYRLSGDSAESVRSVSKAQYERTVQSVYAEVQEAFRATDARAGLLADRVAATQEVLRRAAETLESVAPPREVRDANIVLADALREYANDLEVVRQAAADGDSERVAAFNANVGKNQAIVKIAGAAEDMTHKGYDLGALSED